MRIHVALLAASIAAATVPAPAATVLVEAESFAAPGGWVVDQQFMDQMGSPFLLAHGMGTPVKDATTAVDIPAAGTYRVWVRTRDWVHPYSPGEFALAVNNTDLKPTFGTNGADWAWQDGGTVTLAAGKTTLTLRDKTGFEGRCDAIVLSDDPAFTPPNDKTLAALRKKLLGLPDTAPTAGKYDLVVVGGGIAGTSAALSAARSGLSVALIQDRPVLGGNASSEIRVRPEGKLNAGPYPALVALVNEVTAGFEGRNTSPASVKGDEIRHKLVTSEKTLTLFLDTHAIAVEKDANRIKAVVGKHVTTGKELRFEGRVFADCTGDGTIGFLAGADFRQGRESREEHDEKPAPAQADKMTMGTSNMWYARQAREESKFPLTPWALQFTADTVAETTTGNWDWESGMRLDTIADAERIRDHNFRAVYGNWSFIKNTYTDKYATWKLDWVAYVAGKRESRRLLGDVILTLKDYENKTAYPDGVVETGWPIDVHEPDPKKGFPGEEFRSRVAAKPKVQQALIPYRCLYSRNVDNLLMAGRNISVTHVALGAVRVQKTTGVMGAAIGKAAVVCKAHEATPRDVYAKHWDEMKALMEK